MLLLLLGILYELKNTALFGDHVCLSVYDELNCLSYFCGIHYRSSFQGTVQASVSYVKSVWWHLSFTWGHQWICTHTVHIFLLALWKSVQCMPTFLETVNEILSVFFTFSSDLDKMLHRRQKYSFMSFKKIGTVKVVFYLGSQMNFFVQFSYLLSDWCEIWCKRFTHGSVDFFMIFVKIDTRNAYISCDSKCSNIMFVP